MPRSVACTIKISALKNNFTVVQKYSPHCQIIAMLKANAYGHGSVLVAQNLPEAAAFGVFCIEEAVELRDAGIKQNIIIMQGISTKEQAVLAAKLNLEIVINNSDQLSILKTCKLLKPIVSWLKINTGMNRLGFKSIVQVNDISAVKLKGIMTHFACADEMDNDLTAQQIALFTTITKNLPRDLEISMANSAGIIGWRYARCGWVRPGIMLYGVSPFANTTGLDYGLQPVMTLGSKIISIHDCIKGDKVGYGGKFVCGKDTRIAIVAAGYRDGYPQMSPNGTPVLVNGRRAALVGRVSMDMLTIDITGIDAKIGDSVVLWGDGLPVEEVAKIIGTTGHELVTRIY